MGALDRFRRTRSNGEAPEPKPTARNPIGASGRGHTGGFLDYEEINSALVHPEGQRVFDKMYRTDGDVRQVIQLSINPIIGGTWTVVPYGDQEATPEAVEQADFVRWALFEQMRPNLKGHLIEFLPVLVRAGFAPGFKSWMPVKYKGKTVVIPRSVHLRLPRTIAQWEQNQFGELSRIKQYLPTPVNSLTAREGTGVGTGSNDDEIWMDAKDLVYYRLGAEGDNWEGTSLLRPAYKHWLYKDKGELIDIIGVEREALGVPICYPPLGATPEQLDEMEDILANMRTNEEGYIIAPGPKAGSGLSAEGTGWLIEVIGYDRTGSGRDVKPTLDYHTQKIAAAFISEFMRLGHGSTGARATAQVQADPFLMSIEALATVVEQTLNDDLVAPLVAYNFPNVENPPKLMMSLVDSTSLAQLADFVQKLTQIGALMPDQELEDFLRARADLPPSNPESVKKRKEQDDEMRRMIVTGGVTDPKIANEAGKMKGDTFGANDKPGKPHGTKPAAGSNPGGTSGNNRPTTKSRDDAEGTVTLSHYDELSDRYRPRARRFDEMWVNLDDIEDYMDSMPQQTLDRCKHHVVAMARSGNFQPTTAMVEDLERILGEGYDYGYNTVVNEANAQRPDLQPYDGAILARGARAEGGRLGERAQAIAKRVCAEMEDHAFGASAATGDDMRVQLAAEKAGCKALERAGYDHGVAAILHGRHDAGHWLASDSSPFQLTGVRYSAILDRSTCEHCREADDGVVRELDDPVRLHRMPPNPDCLSNHSGHNRCRCFETYEVLPVSMTQTFSSVESAPAFIVNVAQKLMQSGMPDAARAMQVAEQIARGYCRTGKIAWPGLQDIGSRVDACAAIGVPAS